MLNFADYIEKQEHLMGSSKSLFLQGQGGGSPFTSPAGLAEVSKTEFLEPLFTIV
jgi:hypothetical protein